MKTVLLFFALNFLGVFALAAPRCLNLTSDQANRAVAFLKVSLHQNTPIIIMSKKESGISFAHGAWVEKKKGLKGKRSYRVRLDGREVDISLLYVARSPQHKEAWNLAWLSGCRPAFDKPESIRI